MKNAGWRRCLTGLRKRMFSRRAGRRAASRIRHTVQLAEHAAQHLQVVEISMVISMVASCSRVSLRLATPSTLTFSLARMVVKYRAAAAAVVSLTRTTSESSQLNSSRPRPLPRCAPAAWIPARQAGRSPLPVPPEIPAALVIKSDDIVARELADGSGRNMVHLVYRPLRPPRGHCLCCDCCGIAFLLQLFPAPPRPIPLRLAC